MGTRAWLSWQTTAAGCGELAYMQASCVRACTDCEREQQWMHTTTIANTAAEDTTRAAVSVMPQLSPFLFFQPLIVELCALLPPNSQWANDPDDTK